MQTQSHLPSDPRQEAYAQLLDDPDPRVDLFARLLLAMSPRTVPDRGGHRHDDRRHSGRGKIQLRSRNDAEAKDAFERSIRALQEVSTCAIESVSKMKSYRDRIAIDLEQAEAKHTSAARAAIVARRHDEGWEPECCDIREYEFAAVKMFLQMTEKLTVFRSQFSRYFENYECIHVCEPLGLTREDGLELKLQRRALEDREIAQFANWKRESRVKEISYGLWEKAGRPPDRDEEFWAEACRRYDSEVSQSQQSGS